MHKGQRLTISACRFCDNFAARSGGAIHVRTTSDLSIAATSFEHNQAIQTCGAVLLFGIHEAHISFTNFSHNICIKDTSSLLIDSSRYANLSVLVFYQNQAREAGTELVHKSKIRLADSVFFENSAAPCSALIMTGSAIGKVYRSLFVTDSAFSISISASDRLIVKDSIFTRAQGEEFEESKGDLVVSETVFSRAKPEFAFVTLAVVGQSLNEQNQSWNEESGEFKQEARLRGVSAVSIMCYAIGVMFAFLAVQYCCRKRERNDPNSDHESLIVAKAKLHLVNSDSDEIFAASGRSGRIGNL
jgi:predicted outer membrane repeat protein